MVLSSLPIAVPDPWYTTAPNAALNVTNSDTPLLANDWDAEGDALSAAVVDNPAHGTLSNFQTDGTFTYTPDTGFTGIDTFTYKVNDGMGDSNWATTGRPIWSIVKTPTIRAPHGRTTAPGTCRPRPPTS